MASRFFLERYLRILLVSKNFPSGLSLSNRNSSGTRNCARTPKSLVIKKIFFAFISPRHSIEIGPQLDFLFSPALTSAKKNSSGSTSYFTERKARYGPIDRLCLKVLHPFHFS